MYGINLHAITCRIPRLLLFNKPLIYIALARLMQPRRKPKVGELEVPILIDKNIVWFDVAM